MIPQSDEARFEVSTVCCYSCVMCPRSDLHRKQAIMPNDLFYQLLDKVKHFPQYRKVSFSGFGEPLLDPGLVQKIARTRYLGYETLLLTNGAMLNMGLLREFQSLGVESIRISLYGYSAETYNKVHGVDQLKRISDLILEWTAVSVRPRIILNYLVIQGINDSKEEVESWVNFWRDKVSLVEVWRPHNWADAKCYRTPAKQKVTCGRPFRGPLQIQVDGTVNMCCFDFNGELTLGDLKNQSLDDIFSGIMFNEIKSRHQSGDFVGSGLLCEACDQRNEDKSEALIYSSKFSNDERIKMVSTGYGKLEE